MTRDIDGHHDRTRNNIMFLCKESELTRERQGYYKAFTDLGINVICSGNITSIAEVDLTHTLLILQPDIADVLPFDIFKSTVPTACFQIDTNNGLLKRAKSSALFDVAFVFHPGYESYFKQHGQPDTYLLPHAIERDLFQLVSVADRQFQVGWVGRTDGNNYSIRRRILPLLQQNFIINDPFKQYSQRELIDIYSQSKVVVNISKDDYLKDANIRCFEAMASGALLLTFMPSELTSFGFVEGEHFIGFENEFELIEKIKYYVGREEERNHIAQSAQFMVLANHTYHNRAESILKYLRDKEFRNKQIDEQLQYGLMVYFFVFKRSFLKALIAFRKIRLMSGYKIQASIYLLKLFVSKKIRKESFV